MPYIILSAPTARTATHTRADGSFVRAIDLDGKTVQGDTSRIVDSLDGLTPVPPAPAPVKPVPVRVRTAALRIALFRLHGIQDGAVYAAINASEFTEAQKTEARIQWEYEAFTRRDHPLVNAFAPAFNLTPEQVDDVFRLAATL